MVDWGGRLNARWLFNILSPSGAKARLTVFIFHRVLTVPDPLFPGEPDAARFETQICWIKSWFNVLPLVDAVERLLTRKLPARAAAITFDDGYADNASVALPILQRAGVPATFFIASGYLDGGRMWNDTVIDTIRQTNARELDFSALNLGRYRIDSVQSRQKSLVALLGKLKYLSPPVREKLANDIAELAGGCSRQDLMMTTQQVRALAEAGMTIGAHTVSHPILSRISEQDALAEMSGGKRQLEAITGREVSLFAYPNGKPNIDYLSTHVRLARKVGFAGAVSTGWGAATCDTDEFQIPRFTPWDRSEWRYALRLASNLRHAVAH